MEEKKKPTSEEVIEMLGGAGLLRHRAEARAQMETGLTTKFAWHPWQDINNMGAEGFQFGVREAVLKRLALIAVPAVDVPVIKPRGFGFAIGGFAGGDIFPSSKSGNDVERVKRLPSESCSDLVTAYGKFGLVILESLTAQDTDEAAAALVLHKVVMETPLSEGGVCGVTVVLEELPGWLERGAPLALARACKQGLTLPSGHVQRLPAGSLKKGEQLIAELHSGVLAAVDFATNPSTGILPQTKAQLDGAAGKIEGNKARLDRLDQWLLDEFPSFSMDSEVSRAQKAMADAIEARGGGAPDAEVTRELLRQNAAMIEQNNKTLALLEKQGGAKA